MCDRYSVLRRIVWFHYESVCVWQKISHCWLFQSSLALRAWSKSLSLSRTLSPLCACSFSTKYRALRSKKGSGSLLENSRPLSPYERSSGGEGYALGATTVTRIGTPRIVDIVRRGGLRFSVRTQPGLISIWIHILYQQHRGSAGRRRRCIIINIIITLKNITQPLVTARCKRGGCVDGIVVVIK